MNRTPDRSRPDEVRADAAFGTLVEGLSIEPGGALAVLRPTGDHPVAAIATWFTRAIDACRECGVPSLLILTSGLDPVPHPTLLDRFLIVEELAEHAGGRVAIAFVLAKPVEPRNFAKKAAVALGLVAESFDDEASARDWLARQREP
jgi:hypothetical protein